MGIHLCVVENHMNCAEPELLRTLGLYRDYTYEVSSRNSASKPSDRHSKCFSTQHVFEVVGMEIDRLLSAG